MTGLVRALARLVGGRVWLPAALWAAAILAVSSVPGGTLGGGLFPGCDKVAHLIEYSILGSLLGFWVVGRARADSAGSGSVRACSAQAGSARAGAGRPNAKLAAWLVVAALVFAGLDEVHQRFIPGREMDFWDFSADAAGVVLGVAVALAGLPRIVAAEPRGEERRNG